MDTPVTYLLKQAVRRSGRTRVDLVGAFGYANLTKGCRRLDRHLAGEIREPEFLNRLARVLAIPSANLEVALEVTEGREKKIAAAAAEARRRAEFARRGPHLWVTLPRGYYPSLITVLGPAHFLLVPVPAEIVGLPDYEQFQEVGAIARAHFNDPHRRVREVAGYWYRRSLDETFEFSTEGECLGRTEGPAQTGMVRTGFSHGMQGLRAAMGITED
jgi:hypothetical protein